MASCNNFWSRTRAPKNRFWETLSGLGEISRFWWQIQEVPRKQNCMEHVLNFVGEMIYVYACSENWFWGTLSWFGPDLFRIFVKYLSRNGYRHFVNFFMSRFVQTCNTRFFSDRSLFGPRLDFSNPVGSWTAPGFFQDAPATFWGDPNLEGNLLYTNLHLQICI